MSEPTVRYLKNNFDEAAILACLADLAFSPGFQIDTENQSIIAALRRSSEEFRFASVDEMGARLAEYNGDQIDGLVSNVKGIAFEMEFVELENGDGDSIYASLYPETNHPGYDVQMFDEASGLQWPLQLKATDDLSYVNDWIETHPDGEIIVTDELADKLGLETTGIENGELTARVEEVVDQIINHADQASLWDYFPALSLASVSLVVWELWQRYQRDEISLNRFKILAGMATGLKLTKLAVLIAVLAIPVAGQALGAFLIAQLLYNTADWASQEQPLPGLRPEASTS
ncbi:hypothetical protein D5125_02835 [Magnetovirga frankeli]|uniref:hypothetical protein n=1 Tax=Magnetovirga frankeli TaxID=947516 RepID=UPI001293EEA0|nr:hypothetical protein D5125_02835 [gamma proteobacterium SS-5]